MTNSILRIPSHILRRIDQFLSHIESALLVVTVGCMIVIAFLQVILRNLFDSAILWGDTWLRHLVLWVGFLGASLATRENRHINIDVLARILKPAWRNWVHRFTNLFAAIICGLLVQAAFVFVRYEYAAYIARNDRAAATNLYPGFPLWLFLSVVFIGFIIITFRFLLKALLPADSEVSASGGN